MPKAGGSGGGKRQTKRVGTGEMVLDDGTVIPKPPTRPPSNYQMWKTQRRQEYSEAHDDSFLKAGFQGQETILSQQWHALSAAEKLEWSERRKPFLAEYTQQKQLWLQQYGHLVAAASIQSSGGSGDDVVDATAGTKRMHHDMGAEDEEEDGPTLRIRGKKQQGKTNKNGKKNKNKGKNKREASTKRNKARPDDEDEDEDMDITLPCTVSDDDDDGSFILDSSPSVSSPSSLMDDSDDDPEPPKKKRKVSTGAKPAATAAAAQQNRKPVAAAAKGGKRAQKAAKKDTTNNTKLRKKREQLADRIRVLGALDARQRMHSSSASTASSSSAASGATGAIVLEPAKQKKVMDLIGLATQTRQQPKCALTYMFEEEQDSLFKDLSDLTLDGVRDVLLRRWFEIPEEKRIAYRQKETDGITAFEAEKEKLRISASRAGVRVDL